MRWRIGLSINKFLENLLKGNNFFLVVRYNAFNNQSEIKNEIITANIYFYEIQFSERLILLDFIFWFNVGTYKQMARYLAEHPMELIFCQKWCPIFSKVVFRDQLMKIAMVASIWVISCSKQIIKIFLFNYFNNICSTGGCNEPNDSTSNYVFHKKPDNRKRKRETVKKEKNDGDFSENFVIVYQHFRYKPVFGLGSTGDLIIDNVFGYALTKCIKCVDALKPILENLVKRHQQFRYDICLAAYPQDDSLLPGQVSKAQLNEFFAKVLIGVLPKQLFGSKRNRIYIKDMIARFFKYGYAHDFSVHDTTRRLDVSILQLLLLLLLFK